MDKSLLDRLILVADNLRDVEWELKHRVGHIYIPPHVLGKFYAELDCLDGIINILKSETNDNTHD